MLSTVEKQAIQKKERRKKYNQNYYDKHRYKILKQWSDKKEEEKLKDSPP